MKKLFFSLIATVLLSFTGNAQQNISHNDAKKIAIEHNKYLENLIKTKPTSEKNINDYFANLKFENVSKEQKAEYFTSFSYEANLALLKEHINNKLVFEFFTNCNLIIENEKSSVPEINVQLDNQIELAKKALTNTDLEVCLVYAEVLKKSAAFWLEKERGGSGIGSSFLNTTQANRGTPKSHKVLAADAMGASGALIVGGIAAGFSGPIAPLSFFAVVGASAAWSSGCAAIGL